MDEMRLAGKILGILTGAAFFMTAAADFAFAQALPGSNTSDVRAMSALEFAQKTNGMILVTELAKSQTEDIKKFLEKYLPCQNQACDRETQKCIKGTARSSLNSGSSTYGGTQSNTITTTINCFCVDKNATASDYNHWSWLAFATLRYEDAPDGCDGTVSHRVETGALGVFESSNKQVCYDSSDGHRYCAYIHGDRTTIEYANEEKENAAIRGCEVLPVKLYNYRKCFFCPLVGVIYDGVSKMADLSFAKMSGAFAVLLAVGFAIWIALQVLTQVSSLTKQDAPKFLAALIKQSYKVIIAFFLLHYSSQVFTYIINPIVETGLTFGKNMLTTRDIFRGINYDENGKYIRQAQITGGAHFNLDTYDQLEQYVVAVQQEIAFMQAVGGSLVCTGTNLMMGNELSWWQKARAPLAVPTLGLIGGRVVSKWVDQFADGFQMFVQGAAIGIFGFLLSLAFAFYLIDAIVQVGIVGALLPFLIASWPFKPTAKYTSTGMNMLLNSAFVFLFMGMVISVNVLLINEALNQTADEHQSEQLTQCSDPAYYKEHAQECAKLLDDTPRMGALYNMAQALNSQDANKLKDLTDISALGFLILLFCCIFGFKFTGQALALAGKFASGGMGKPIAPSIATMGASATKSLALSATKETREAIGKRFDHGVESVVSAPYRAAKWGFNKLRGKDQKGSGGAGGQGASGGGALSKAGSAAGAAAAAAAMGAAAKAQNAQGAPTLNEGSAGTGKPTLNEGGKNPAADDEAILNEGLAPEDENLEATAENDAAETDATEGGEDFETSEASEEGETAAANNTTAGAAQSRRQNRDRAAPAEALSGNTREAKKARQMSAALNKAGIKKQDYSNRRPKGGSKKNRSRRGKKRK